MEAPHPPSAPAGGTERLQRRGLLAATAALAAAVLAKFGVQRAEATDNAPIIAAQVNSETTTTQLAATGGGVNGALLVTNTGGYGVVANVFASPNIAFYGVSGAGYGTFGDATGGVGAQGRSNNGPGVAGQSGSSYGVYGTSGSSYGVVGTSSFGGVFGDTDSGVGLSGRSVSGTGAIGSSTSGIGVQGQSGSNIGVAGQSPNIAVYGFSPSGQAARFDGPVLVNGSFTVRGAFKAAAVPHPDGTHRRLYCMESPESWFEDFGEAQLNGGRATINLDPDFAAVVHSQQYHVFLSEYDDSSNLYVANRRPGAFDVHAKDHPSGNSKFSYRVVAKRRDIPGRRLEKVSDLPTLTLAPDRTAGSTPPPLPPTPHRPQ
jgi:hypothetical protein